MSSKLENAVLLLVDLQNDTIHPDGAFKATGTPEHAVEQDVVTNAIRLADAARVAAIPVIHIHHRQSVGATNGRDAIRNAPLFENLAESEAMSTAWGAAPVVGLEPAENDTVITKQRCGAFTATSLDVKLRGLGAKTVIVAGAVTNLSVENTVRSGADLGYQMVLVEDACSSFDSEWHQNSIKYALTYLSEVVKVSDVLDSIRRR